MGEKLVGEEGKRRVRKSEIRHEAKSEKRGTGWLGLVCLRAGGCDARVACIGVNAS